MKKVVTNSKKLREISTVVTEVNEAKQIIEELKKSLKAIPHGIGLGAIQIGIPKRIAVIERQGTYLELINPVIISKEEEFIYIDEGCLSIPNEGHNTKRYRHIHISTDYIDDDELKTQELYFYYGGKKEVNSDGLVAIAVQHEIDHMDGILTIDHKVAEVKQEPQQIISNKVGRNDPCPCGSGKKYKKCCL